MSDLLHQQLSTVQSNLQPNPPTIAAAATISPTTLVTFITGTIAVNTLNPPVTGAHILILIFTNTAPGVIPVGTGVGQFKASVTPTQNIPVVCIFDPITQLYWAGVLKAS
ncbi:hypothetical protein HYZ97_02775 [Candidatus Pacearchaeota archaeon]|nr:hypothetical protein [Candidatus Pacearchaeota archaeon]